MIIGTASSGMTSVFQGTERKKTEEGIEKLLEKKKVAENFPALKKETDIQVQEFQSSK